MASNLIIPTPLCPPLHLCPPSPQLIGPKNFLGPQISGLALPSPSSACALWAERKATPRSLSAWVLGPGDNSCIRGAQSLETRRKKLEYRAFLIFLTQFPQESPLGLSSSAGPSRTHFDRQVKRPWPSRHPASLLGLPRLHRPIRPVGRPRRSGETCPVHWGPWQAPSETLQRGLEIGALLGTRRGAFAAAAFLKTI